MNIFAKVSVPTSKLSLARQMADILGDYHAGMFRSGFNSSGQKGGNAFYVSSGMFPEDSWMIRGKAETLAALIDTNITTDQVEEFFNCIDIHYEVNLQEHNASLGAELSETPLAETYDPDTQYNARDRVGFRNHVWVNRDNGARWQPGVQPGFRQHWSTVNNTTTPGPDQSGNTGNWMRGNWGVRFVLPGGIGSRAANFDVTSIINTQLSTLRTPLWCMTSLAQPSNGNYYCSPSALLESINPKMSTPVDHLGIASSALQAAAWRHLVYFASQGPDLNGANLQSIERLRINAPDLYDDLVETQDDWFEFVESQNKTHHQAVADYILEPYATTFGADIDGWWFDHGYERGGDYDLFRAAVKAGNSNAAVAWNQENTKTPFQGQELWFPTISRASEEYVGGHHSSSQNGFAPWDDRNDVVFERTVAKALANDEVPVWHWFIPAQNNFRSGDEVFPVDKMIKWTRTMLRAGGAVTWALGLEFPEFLNSAIRSDVMAAIQQLDIAMQADLPNLR